MYGFLSGYGLSGVAYDGLVYVSDNVGKISDTVGTKTVNVGRVVGMTDPDVTKILFVIADWLRTWA